jgi:hypothetical protein
LRINQKTVGIIGWAASAFSMLLALSFLDQIRLNLSGHPGSVLVPITLVMNCIAWLAYGALLERRNWQLIAANSFGAVIGIATVITAIA